MSSFKCSSRRSDTRTDFQLPDFTDSNSKSKYVRLPLESYLNYAELSSGRVFQKTIHNKYKKLYKENIKAQRTCLCQDRGIAKMATTPLANAASAATAKAGEFPPPNS
ncbi:hypothetical protein F8388_000090 [Cannabis sativa]|uniref:Uncharacterized protein n=1 Tax=Cannabis sativa TaxID=3483 RepID=A0A7J6FMJ0_CANSA|nr:hypothetical protein F8388_000090 [Cannabis sativa]